MDEKKIESNLGLCIRERKMITITIEYQRQQQQTHTEQNKKLSETMMIAPIINQKT